MTLLRLPARTGLRRGAGRQPRPRPCLDKIVNTRYASLIALLAMNDLGGTQARDFGPQLNHGTYVGAKLGEAGLDGEPCAFFGGSAKVQFGSAAFAADWNGDLHSIIAWGRMDQAGRWSDGTEREALRIIGTVDTSGYALLRKVSTGNQLRWHHRSGAGVSEVSLVATLAIPPLD